MWFFVHGKLDLSKAVQSVPPFFSKTIKQIQMDAHNNNLQGNIQTIGFNNMETFLQATKRVIRETVNSEVIVAFICTLIMIVLFGMNL